VNHGGATRDEDQTGLFSLRRRRFGRAEYASSIEGTVQNVDGVLWAKVTVFDDLNDSDDPATIVLPATSVREPVVGCDSNFVLSLFHKHVSLTAVAQVGT
jgi:hypothetical protein